MMMTRPKKGASAGSVRDGRMFPVGTNAKRSHHHRRAQAAALWSTRPWVAKISAISFAQIKQASENIADSDARTARRIERIEKSVNDIYLKVNRPGGSWHTADDDEVSERKFRNRVKRSSPTCLHGLSVRTAGNSSTANQMAFEYTNSR
jgi:hypothetical protein